MSVEGLCFPEQLLHHFCAQVDFDTIMMTSPIGIIFRVTGPLCGEFTGPDEFTAQ